MIASTHATEVQDPSTYLKQYPQGLKTLSPNLEDITIYSIDMEDGAVLFPP
jgi:hypothetical protein